MASASSARLLAPSRSSPNLYAPSADTVCVLGRECRSRRRLVTADSDVGSLPPSLADLKGAHNLRVSTQSLRVETAACLLIIAIFSALVCLIGCLRQDLHRLKPQAWMAGEGCAMAHRCINCVQMSIHFLRGVAIAVSQKQRFQQSSGNCRIRWHCSRPC